MKAKGQGKLSHKFVWGFLILGILICASTCYIGFHQYKGTIERMYNENAYLIAEVAASYIDGDRVADYWQTQTTDAAYAEMASRIDSLFAVSKATYIYLYIPTEDYQCLNLYDATKTPLGAIYGMAVEEPEKVLDIFRSGERADDYFIRKSEYGYNTAAVEPIKNSAGQTTALLTVDISMDLIESSLRQYVLSAITISCLLVAVFIAAYLLYLRRHVIKPLLLITQETDRFIDQHTQISTQLETIHTQDEIQSLAQAIHQMQVDINDYIDNLTRVTAEKERIGAELNVATRIQANMLPSIFPPYPERDEFDLYATMTPAKEVGGDFYDFFLVDQDHLALVMADVSGKGVPAALFMVIAKTMLKNSAQTGLSPQQVLEKVNNQLCENNDAEMFVTVWLGILELSSGRLVCANAGHEYPALRRRGQPYALVQDKHGFVLAGLENARYREYELELQPGDQLYVYTDGVAEATDANNELFGTQRMLDALNSRAEAGPQELLQAVKVGIDGFVREAPQFDDITMLALTYLGPQA